MCWMEGEGSGEEKSSQRGWVETLRYNSLPALSTLQLNDTQGTRNALQTSASFSLQNAKEEGRDHFCLALRASSHYEQIQLKVPLGADTTRKWYLPFEPSRRDPRSVRIRESNVRFYLLVLENITGQAAISFGKLKYGGRVWLVFPPNSSTPQWEQMGSTRIKPNNETEQMRAIQ